MTFEEYKISCESGSLSLKQLSRMLAQVDIDDRKEAGKLYHKFRESQTDIKPYPVSIPKEMVLWTHDRWPLGHGCKMLVNKLVIHGDRTSVVITGRELKIKVIHE